MLTVAQLIDFYTSTITNILDNMLPRRKIWKRLRPLVVWIDADYHRLRLRTQCLDASRSTETPAFTACEFLEALITKIDSLHASTANAPPSIFTSMSIIFDGFNL
jgi:hypothetical protein